MSVANPTLPGKVRPFTGRHMLLSMIAFFGVIIAVNMLLMVMALTTDNGLVVKNSYVASQDFNRKLADARAQAALNWTVDIAHADATTTLTYRDADGQPLTGLHVRARIGRPVTDRDDRQVTLYEGAAGTYSFAGLLPTGIWSIDAIAVDAEGRQFRQIFRIKGGDAG
ncbi:MAG: FixH family protein [Minwuia sp.]|nr:FixH family protein [Minwuia sp.]